MSTCIHRTFPIAHQMSFHCAFDLHLCWHQKEELHHKFSWMLNHFSVQSDLYKYQSQTEHPHPCLQGNWVGGFETDSPVRTCLYSKQLWGCRPGRTHCSLSDALRAEFRWDDKSNQWSKEISLAKVNPGEKTNNCDWTNCDLFWA